MSKRFILKAAMLEAAMLEAGGRIKDKE